MAIKSTPKSTHLYVFQCNDLYKIGITHNVEQRLKTLQTGNPYPVDVVYCEERYNPSKAERHLHKYFSKRRVQGEWFKQITVDEIRIQLMLFTDQECEPAHYFR